MNGIPVLTAEGDCIARAWENAMLQLFEAGCDIQTQYDKPDDPPSKDATMIITVPDPLAEPMIHRDFPGGPEELQEYVMEVCEGIKDHCVRDPATPATPAGNTPITSGCSPTRCRRCAPIDQIEQLCRQLAETPYTRRAQAVTWKVWEDNDCYDPACLQSIWCRIIEQDGRAGGLSMNVRFRSNDAYKAAFMNMFALVQLQAKIAARIGELTGNAGRSWAAIATWPTASTSTARTWSSFAGGSWERSERRSFEQRTMRYEGDFAR